MATHFNYGNMQAHMKNLDANFAYFADTLKKANDLVNDFVSVSPSSSIYGEKAKKILNLWNQNASTFGDFYQNFESWSALLVNALDEYRKLEESIFSASQTMGDTADGVAKSREQVRGISAGNGAFSLPDGSTIQYLKDEKGETYALLKKNDMTIKRVFQEDGSFLDYDLDGNLLTPVTSEVLDETFISKDELGETVTVSSGQAVNLNGEKCYFLVRDFNGIDYYVKSKDANEQVFIADANGSLTPYASSNNDEIISREDFVDKVKDFGAYNWNITYNNGTSPYQAIGTQVDPSFTENVKNADYTNVVYAPEYLQSPASLEQLKDVIKEGNENFPSVVYVAPGQSIKYDVPKNMTDNVIGGGEDGTYLVYNPEMQGYFKIDKNGSYNTSSGIEERNDWWIPKEQLLSNRLTIKDK